jgi:HPt (histidine-containing phosphotransfer) domain-containing protein
VKINRGQSRIYRLFELGRRAHSLKHAATSFGLVGLAAVAFRIEQAADAGDKAVVENRTASLKAVAEMELGVFGDATKRQPS